MTIQATVDAFAAAHHATDIPAMAQALSDRLRFFTLLGMLGKKDYVDFAQAISLAMPDLTFDIDTVRIDGNDVTMNFGLRGTHERTFDLKAPGMKPLPATGKHIILRPGLLHWVVDPESGLITSITPEPGHEGGVVYLLTEMGAKLPPLWIARIVNRVAQLARR